MENELLLERTVRAVMSAIALLHTHVLPQKLYSTSVGGYFVHVSAVFRMFVMVFRVRASKHTRRVHRAHRQLA